MSVQIYNDQAVPLQTIEYGGVEPYVSCIQWYGYTGGVTANAIPILSSSVSAPATYNPYIISSHVGCASGTGLGSLVGTFIANGYTGPATMWVESTDSVGCTALSNILSYNVIALNAFRVYAGATASLSTSVHTYTINDAFVEGGSGPYTYHWVNEGDDGSVISGSGTINPTISNIYSYITNWTLIATDSAGHSGASDNIIHWGSQPPPPLTVSGSFDQSSWSSTVSPGTAAVVLPYHYNIYDEAGTIITYHTPSSFTSNSTNLSGSTDIVGPIGATGRGDWNVEVNDSTSPVPRSGTATGLYNYRISCFLKGTMITMEDMSIVAIENLKVGDHLLSNNIGVSESWGLYYSSNPDLSNVSTQITMIEKDTASSYYKINNGLLNVTAEHPIFIYNSLTGVYTFKAVRNLRIGDVLINGIEKNQINIENIEIVNENVEIYKITTSPKHTFIANQIIVHNVKTGGY